MNIRKLFICVCAAALLSGGCGQQKNPAQSGSSPVEIKLKEVKRGDIIEKLSEVGKLEPLSSVKVKSNVTGTVKKLLVDDGNIVKKGQLLAVIQPGREAEQYQSSEVRATASGVIIDKSVEEGDMVTSGLSEYSGGSVMMTIADMSRMLVRVDINEVDIGKIKVGLAAKIRVEAFSDKQIEGKVTRISPMAKLSSDGKINVFNTEVEVITKVPELRPGMKTVVEIKLDERKNVLVLPIEAVFEEKDDETGVNEQVLYVCTGPEQYERKSVKPGLYDDANIEILEGAAEKDKVAVSKPVGFGTTLKVTDRSKVRRIPGGNVGRSF